MLLLADAAAGAETAAWVGTVSVIVNMGFSAIVAWWLLTKSIPRMQETFTNALTAERDISKENVQALMKDNKERLEYLLNHCERETARRDETLKLNMDLINSTLVNVGEGLEQVREGLQLNREEFVKRTKRGGS